MLGTIVPGVRYPMALNIKDPEVLRKIDHLSRARRMSKVDVLRALLDAEVARETEKPEFAIVLLTFSRGGCPWLPEHDDVGRSQEGFGWRLGRGLMFLDASAVVGMLGVRRTRTGSSRGWNAQPRP